MRSLKSEEVFGLESTCVLVTVIDFDSFSETLHKFRKSFSLF